MANNKENAIQCIKLAEKAIEANDVETAERLLMKAEKLHPSSVDKKMLKKVQDWNAGHRRDSSDSTTKLTNTQVLRVANGTTDGAGPSRQNMDGSQYTQEQVEIVHQISKCKNYYEVLEVPKDALEVDIKKAFRKLALLVHPDKNHAPGASEAMKVVCAAAEVLVDADKRRRYDLDQETKEQGHNLDNMSTSRGIEVDDAVVTGLLIALGSVAVFYGVKAVIDFFRRKPEKEPLYSFKRSNKHPVERITADKKILYYVTRSFHQDYTGSLWQLEIMIEEDYLNNCK